MTAELARIGGPVAAIALAVLLIARRREVRLGALVLLAAAAALLVAYLAPQGRGLALALAAPAGLIVAALLSLPLGRWAWLLPMAALACVPARIPVDVGAEEANLLLPLYGVIAAAAVALARDLLRASVATRARASSGGSPGRSRRSSPGAASRSPGPTTSGRARSSCSPFSCPLACSRSPWPGCPGTDAGWPPSMRSSARWRSRSRRWGSTSG